MKVERNSAPTLLLTPRQAAAALSISERSLWSLTKSGAVPSIKIGRLVRYRPESLRVWLTEREQSGAKE